MPIPMTDEQLDAYRATAERRRLEAIELAAERRKRAWEAAGEGAELLRSRFGASSVLVFGSLVKGDRFGPRSDIDLAARGLRFEDYFTAVGALQGLGGEFEVDLVDLDRCPASLAKRVLAGGRPL